MQKAKLMLTGLTFLGIAALAGCSFPGVYKIDIQQGNVVTQDMIDQLRPGMTQRQVRFIMGNPLVADTFHPNRWDYIYSMQPGGGERQQERVGPGRAGDRVRRPGRGGQRLLELGPFGPHDELGRREDLVDPRAAGFPVGAARPDVDRPTAA